MSVPTTARLDRLHTLAQVAASGRPVAMNALYMTPEGVLAVASPPRPSKLNFVVDGLMFHASIAPAPIAPAPIAPAPIALANKDDGSGDPGSVGQIWAEVGMIPFTAQSPHTRRTLINLLRSIQSMGLPRARFVVEGQHKILLFCECRTEQPMNADDLIYEIVLLVQEARPFLRLLAEYL
ncbi:hypothetical protein M2352_000133 [Azospirillum fermentarium]|uniref:hypothetical protein n=1 Tax=Azospirillum fermentarium TaxID=1233114 RepID=UPI00222711DC|nr:hypothetical protein [Azospirillum fermentarium]MCW2244542.1 hypothetical protein [Azospirillum fermentarium]